MGDTKVYKTTCRMCGTLCGIDAHICDNKLVYVEGDKDNLRSHGRTCIKGSSSPTWLNLPDRLMKPLKKNASGAFEEISYEQALDEIAQKLLSLQKEYGPNTIGVWKGEGIDFAQQEELARRFIHAVGSPNYFSNDTQCFASRYLAFSLIYGCWPMADYANAKLVLQWGTNAPISHPDWMQSINLAREQGGKLIVVDTRYTEIARQADIFIKIKPGTDGALAWGIIREMIRRGEVDYPFVEQFTVGFDQVKEYAESFTPEKVEEITTVKAEYIGKIVDEIAKARPRICSWIGTGLEHQINGVNTIRSVALIDVLAGTTDREGGMKIPSPFGMRSLTIYDQKPLLELSPIGREQFPVLYERRQECHTLRLMDQILSGQPYPFTGLVMTAANPVMTNANSAKVKEALSKLKLLVVRDLFLTETAQLADYVLPAASFLEREEIFCSSAEGTAFITGKYLDYDLPTEYQFFKALAQRMGAEEWFPWEDDRALNEWLLEPTGYTTADLHQHPSGFIKEVPALEKHLAKAARGEKPFNTPSGKVELFSAYLEEKQRPGICGLPKFLPSYFEQHADPEYPYMLATGARRQKYFHGRYRNIPQFYAAEPHGFLEMHPDDAAELQLKDGDRVRVSSSVGSIETYVKILHEKEIFRGSVQHTHGYVGENVNLLTYDFMEACDPISGFPALKSVWVKIEKLDEK